MRTIVYVDGFNLYYGALKGSPWKWLDLLLLFETILQPHHEIRAIKYYTARVSSTSGDEANRFDYARKKSPVPSTHGACRLLKTYQGQRASTFAVAGPDPRHQYL